MQLADFEDALDSYGADLEDWPEALRSAARAFLSSSTEARALLEAELRLQAAFAAAPAIKAPNNLAQRIGALAALEAEQVPVKPAPAREKPGVRTALRAMAGKSAMAFRPVYALAMALCFIGGLVGSQLVPEPQDDAIFPYVASVYGDLAY